MECNFSLERLIVPARIIDEEPEFDTDVEFKEMEEDDFLKKIMVKFSKGYKTRTILAMSCSSFGMLCLVIPITIKKCGIFSGAMIYFFVYFCNLFTLYLLLKVILKTNKSSYRQVVYIYKGKTYGKIFDIVKIIYSFLQLSLHQMFHYQIIVNLLKDFELTNKGMHPSYAIGIIGLPMIVHLPLTRLKFTRFNYVNFLSTILTFMFFVVIGIYLPYIDFSKKKKQVMLFGPNYKFYLFSYSIITTVFGSHFTLFDHLSQFILKTTKRSTSVLIWSQTLKCISIFLLMYLGFFVNSDPSDPYFSIIILNGKTNLFVFFKLLVLGLFFFLVPLHLKCCTQSFEDLFTEPKQKIQFNSLIIEVLGAFLFLILGAIFMYYAKNPIVIVSFIGGVCSSVLFYIFPVLCYSNAFMDRGWKYYSGYIIMGIHFFIGIFLAIVMIIEFPNIQDVMKLV